MNTFLLALSLLSLAAAQDVAAPASAACQQLEAKFPEQLVVPGEAQYVATNKNFFDYRAVKRPGCIFLPKTTEDVAAGLKILTATKTKFAVKSGGHMPGEFANIDNGVLIATEFMNAIEWDGDDVLKTQPGPRWGAVYKKANEKQRIVVGGRLSQVGVAGLVLGGGISWVGGEYGFACDNVKGYEVVLANSTVVYASETTYPDLYKALRGGSSNFGIVTRFDLDAYPLPEGWANAGMTIGAKAENTAEFLDAITEYAITGATEAPKTGVICVISNVPAFGIAVNVANLWQSAPQAANSTPAVFEKFLKLSGTTHTTQAKTTLLQQADTFGAMQDQLNIFGGTPINAFRTASYRATPEMIAKIAEVHAAEFATLKGIDGLMTTIAIQPITKNHILVGSKRRGGNVLGLDKRVDNGPFVWTEQFASWANPADSEKVQTVQRTIVEKLKAYAVEKGLWDPYVYLNDADTEQIEDVMEGYGEENWAFLKATAKKYDPEGVFQNLMPGGFKI